ncbi:MAG: protein translocase subunit SecD [Verrucomicrobiota bacterium]|nr:protein translocase subunit SecD [Verrucomicrobiota bacterium]
MKPAYFYKWLLVIILTVGAITEITPFKDKNLIDQFEQDATSSEDNKQLLETVLAEAREMEKASPGRTYANLFDAIGSKDISSLFPNIAVAEDEDQPVKVVLNKLQEKAKGEIRLGLDLQGGVSFTVAMETNVLSADRDKDVALEQAMGVLRSRVDKFGVAEPLLQTSGENEIEIEMPGLSEQDYQSVRDILTRPAYLEFRMVHERSQELLARGFPVPGYEVLTERKASETPGQPDNLIEYLVKIKPEQGLTGTHISAAGVYPNPMTGEPEIDFTLTTEGALLFADITRQNVGRQLAIVLDGELKSAPVIRGAIEQGRGQITGDYEMREAFELSNVLENPLEAPVRIVEENSTGPTLGQDSVNKGVKASIIGLVLVAIFMLVYYMGAGLIANFALMLNIVLLMGVLCMIDATLTLPGIAGIVLTVGMAVDANVLIFERIREELALGKSTRGAIEAGFAKAFGTIFDANVTTLIASIILINMGKGPVKGFGVTLTIGIIASMFTALFVTRLVLEGALSMGLKNFKLRQLPFLRHCNFDFMRLWKSWFGISWALILVGIGFGFYRGGDVFGVDFAGGDSMTYRFEQKIPVEKIREAVDALEIGETQIAYERDITLGLGDGSESLEITAPFDQGEQITAMLKEQFSEAEFGLDKTSRVGGSVGSEIQKSAIIALTLALFGILIYVALRYEFSFAIGAVLAVIHDILMTLGIFFMFGRDLNAPMVAAILTIIGFSINDTIVIFDRIREDLKLGVKGSFKDVMNKAINETLGRTVITSGTTLLAALALFIYGGTVINDFAFTFVVGIITGTYSSIYIAASIVLWYCDGKKPKLMTSEVTDDIPHPAKA